MPEIQWGVSAISEEADRTENSSPSHSNLSVVSDVTEPMVVFEVTDVTYLSNVSDIGHCSALMLQSYLMCLR